MKNGWGVNKKDKSRKASPDCSQLRKSLELVRKRVLRGQFAAALTIGNKANVALKQKLAAHPHSKELLIIKARLYFYFADLHFMHSGALISSNYLKSHIQTVGKLFREFPLDKEIIQLQVDALEHEAISKENQNKNADAILPTRRAIELIEKNQWMLNEGKWIILYIEQYQRLGRCYGGRLSGNAPIKGFDCYEKARTLAKKYRRHFNARENVLKAEYAYLKYSIESSCGLLHERAGDYFDAIKCFKRAYQISTEHLSTQKNPFIMCSRSEARYLVWIGNNHGKLGDVKNETKYYRLAFSKYAEIVSDKDYSVQIPAFHKIFDLLREVF